MKKIIIISIKCFIGLICLSLITGLILLIIDDIKNSKEFIEFSEIQDIQNYLSKYHLKFGKYPVSQTDVIINMNVLCDSGFKNKKLCTSIFWIPEKLSNIFVYKQNLDGVSYNIELKTLKDNKYLGCVNEKKTKKKGCLFIINPNQISLSN